MLDQVLADTSALLDRFPNTLEEASWQQMVDLLDHAGLVWLYGIGPAGLQPSITRCS